MINRLLTKRITPFWHLFIIIFIALVYMAATVATFVLSIYFFAVSQFMFGAISFIIFLLMMAFVMAKVIYGFA